ncbi:membrane protein [Sediminibacter sp. Hel_I_10]|uniref:membrane protein n=1 Tax=Sediminibacter sp. Hel_I_10 TaxID=1392490 RepID=UPI00047931A7|nr:membrane protein [Sediminibacter sp. Hel_I_10]
MSQSEGNSNKMLAIVAYITIIGTLIAFFMNREKRDELVSFHIRQALGLWLLQFILGYFIGGFDSWMITTSFWIFFIVLFLYGIFGAVAEKQMAVPVLGPFFQRLFKSIGQ